MERADGEPGAEGRLQEVLDRFPEDFVSVNKTPSPPVAATGQPRVRVKQKLKPLDRAVLEEVVRSDVRMTREMIRDAAEDWQGKLRGYKIDAISDSVKRLLGAKLIQEPDGLGNGLEATTRGIELSQTNPG